MYGLPKGISVMNEDPFNVRGTVCWLCNYLSEEQAAEVLQKAFPAGSARGITPLEARKPGRAMVQWEFNGNTYQGDVLVDKTLTPVGFYLEINWGHMVFTLDGDHIPYARFPDGHEALRTLEY